MNKITLMLALVLGTFSVQASELGMTAEEAYAKTQGDTQVLLVDVRDPVEIMFIGSAEAADINIPFMLVDRSRYNTERNIFALDINPDFAQQVKDELTKRGLDETTEVITMCRSGSERGEPSAKVLLEAGLINARYVIHGFQGDAIKEGPQAGMRVLNGWQNSGLPWTRDLNPETIYRVDR